ncbi:DUF484 family protein [Thalassotalea euphylliae]|uniref:DUF484 family protein n=1 Tax=Thalassotalea euphylliae TaxID=1655234 RepID=A0A3E0UJP5_9GAMM|nr:DUF484 family protein [Thalassotalea euphylliae]REL37171.1 DUF484 family protein [Thalassotalea euphylliae]
MNEQNPLHADDLPLTDDLVVRYLEDNPEFFSRNPSLITSLRLQDPHRGTVSLVERQQTQLRQKIQGLEEEITQLMSVANNNEQLFRLYSDLYLQLIDSKNVTQLLDILTRATLELLSLSGLKLWLTPSFIANHATPAHDSVIVNDCQSVIETRLANEDYYFGRLQQSELQQIFGHGFAGSVVLIKLEHAGQDIGFLAISSQDADHFDPRMDTLLLSQFQKLVAKLLFQHLEQ